MNQRVVITVLLVLAVTRSWLKSVTFSYLMISLPGPQVYVLGGLVDENIKKNLTLERAQALNIATARLPISELCDMADSSYAPILSINQVGLGGRRNRYCCGRRTINSMSSWRLFFFAPLQVFDGLMTLRRTGSWHAALKVALPERKGFKLLDPAVMEQRVQALLTAQQQQQAGTNAGMEPAADENNV